MLSDNKGKRLNANEICSRICDNNRTDVLKEWRIGKVNKEEWVMG